MNRKFLSLSLALFGVVNMAVADIVITLPENSGINSINYIRYPINQTNNAKSRAEMGVVRDSVLVVNNVADIDIPKVNDNFAYSLILGNKGYVDIFVTPQDNLKMDVTSTEPFDYILSGTPLTDGLNELNKINKDLRAQNNELWESESPSEEALEKYREQYVNAQKKFIEQNPDSPVVLVALMNLDGEDYINCFDALTEKQKQSFIYPLSHWQYRSEMESLENERKLQALAAGDVEAPGFTLKDLDGKDVSLSDFRGKWVILDFWGSWCVWCIRGIPELKDAYEKYAGKLEIIGIDCNESEEAWKAGVEKYELPWVNVYNPKDSDLTAKYGVQGFPTKAIVDPQGKIRNITVGHDPKFYTALTELIGE